VNQPLIEPLHWDSDFFGYSVAKIHLDSDFHNVDELKKLTKEQKIRLCYVFADSTHEPALERHLNDSFVLADRKRTYSMILNKNSLRTKSDKKSIGFISLMNSLDNKLALEIALESGEQSRFKTDSNFISGEFERLYEKWYEQSVMGKMAYETIGINHNLELAGIVTLMDKKDFGQIGLIAISKAFRGQGLGKILMAESLNNFFSKGFSCVKVITQSNNFAACKLYESMGFSVEKDELVYHLWTK